MFAKGVCVMKVYSVQPKFISVNLRNKDIKRNQPNFEGRHDCAKLFGGICAGLGTLGALGGIAIMTGGVSLIPTLAYGALCGGIGAVGGHMVDKDQPEYKDKTKK